mgnify:CR=1 FL=1
MAGQFVEGDAGVEGLLADLVEGQAPNDQGAGLAGLDDATGTFEGDPECVRRGGPYERCRVTKLAERTLSDEATLIEDDHIIGKFEFKEEAGPYDVALIGDYNIGGDVWAAKPILEEIGLNVKSVWTGDGEVEKIGATHSVKLNLIHCYRSMNYMCKVMEEKWGIPWLEYNFFGPTKIEESLRAIAECFDDKIKKNVEKVIKKYKPEMQAVVDEYKPRLDGKTAMLFVGGLRPRHTIGAYEDLGIQITGAGYEFAHQDDYDRTAPEMAKGTLIYDDVSEFELEKFVEELKPDLVGNGMFLFSAWPEDPGYTFAAGTSMATPHAGSCATSPKRPSRRTARSCSIGTAGSWRSTSTSTRRSPT